MEVLRELFSASGFMPHGFCYLWNPGLVWLHVISDSLIAISYTLIPLTLLRLVRKRRDIPFNWMFVCFGVFIVACGATHVMEVWTLWVPSYWLSGVVKAITALASVPTAVLLVQLLPKALSLPHPDELRQANAILERQALTLREQAALLRQSEEHYRSLFEGAPYGILRVSLDGTVLMVNPTLVSILGLDSDTELVGQALPVTFRGATGGQDALNAPGKASTADYEENGIVWTRKDGKKILLHIKTRLLPQSVYSPACCEIIVDDVSERQLLEDELRQAQKMESVGRLAGGIAHDFNNLLVGILGYGDLLVKGLVRGTKVHEYSKEIVRSAVRARDLTAQLLAFGRKQHLQPKIIDVNSEIANMTDMLVRTLGEDIRLVQELAPDLKSTNMDPVQFEQMILNLVVNARDAMPAGGTLRIKTSNEFGDLVSPVLEQRNYTVVSVEDTGTGIDAEALPRIYEPFFTTKGLGHGTGLGLAMVYSTVKQSGGFIKVTTEVGKGTCFYVYLPCAERKSESPYELALSMAHAGSEAILLVEDDEIVRTLTAEVLEAEGYNVLTAKSGSEGMELFGKSPVTIHLLVTDVVMPDMNGLDLARQLKRKRPDLRVLYISGYVDNQISAQIEVNRQSFFLAKPFLPWEFLGRIREILDSPGGPATSVAC